MAPEDQQVCAAQDAQRPKRRYVRRRKGEGSSSLDIAFEKTFRTARGKYAGRKSGADILLEQECERALAGNSRSLMAVIRHHEANQKALEEWQSQFGAPEPDERDRRKLIEAALILDIFNLDVGVKQRKRHQDGVPTFWTDWSMLLSDWAAAAGVQRHEARLEEELRYEGLDGDDLESAIRKRKQQQALEPVREFTADIYIKDPLEPEIRKRVLAALAAARSPEANRWPKGHSGNSFGGAYKLRKFQLPFGYLEELVVVEVGGRERELTRFEALISQLQEKALSESSPATRQLASVLAKQRLAKWVPKYPMLPAKPETCEERERRLAETIPKTVYECMATLGMLSARAKKTDLLEPWIVELALKRLKRRRLNLDQQRAVMRVTRRPHDYIWPKWWNESLFGEGGRKPMQRPGPRKRPVRGPLDVAPIIEDHGY